MFRRGRRLLGTRTAEVARERPYHPAPRRSRARVLQQRRHQSKHHGEGPEAEGEERKCTDCDERPKVHPGRCGPE
jgi:hypothetical protein